MNLIMKDQPTRRENDMTSTTCEAQIDLATPTGRERVRGFQPPWRTVFVYTCPACSSRHRVYANSFLGRHAVPGLGAIICDRPITHSSGRTPEAPGSLSAAGDSTSPGKRDRRTP